MIAVSPDSPGKKMPSVASAVLRRFWLQGLERSSREDQKGGVIAVFHDSPGKAMPPVVSAVLRHFWLHLHDASATVFDRT